MSNMEEAKQHFAAHPYYLMGTAHERNRIITEVEIYLASRVNPSYSINITTLRELIAGERK